MRNKRYTHEEKELIARKVSDNPCNLSKAFREAAEELDRDANCIRVHYYNNIRKNNYCFVIVGRNTSNINGKIVTEKTSDNRKRSAVRFFHNIIHYLLGFKNK
jgi:hypothetical protein